jgi:hypothetical protein
MLSKTFQSWLKCPVGARATRPGGRRARADDHIAVSQSETLHAAAPDHSQLMLLDSDDHVLIVTERTRRS